MSNHQEDLIRREAFVHGFVAARDPKTPHDTLLMLEEAERAYILYAAEREDT